MSSVPLRKWRVLIPFPSKWACWKAAMNLVSVTFPFSKAWKEFPYKLLVFYCHMFCYYLSLFSDGESNIWRLIQWLRVWYMETYSVMTSLIYVDLFRDNESDIWRHIQWLRVWHMYTYLAIASLIYGDLFSDGQSEIWRLIQWWPVWNMETYSVMACLIYVDLFRDNESDIWR